MDHEADVRLIDAHSERHCCHDHVDIVALERFLVSLALLRWEPSMIGQRLHPTLPKEVAGLLDSLSAEAIHDPALTSLATDQRENLVPCIAGALLPDRDV